MSAILPSLSTIEPNTPLRLSAAAAFGFPDGSMAASGLRREAARGRLVIERIAGKDYTTLANIERMRELCRLEAKERDSGSGPRGETRLAKLPDSRSGLSSTKVGTSPRDALKAKLAAQSES